MIKLLVSISLILTLSLQVFAKSESIEKEAESPKLVASEESRALCLNAPDVKEGTPSTSKTEAKGDCLDCLKQKSKSASVSKLKANLQVISKDAQEKRDVTFLRFFLKIMAQESDAEQLAEDLKNEKRFNELTGFAEKSKEAKLFAVFDLDGNNYVDKMDDKQDATASKKQFLNTTSELKAVLLSRIEVMKKHEKELPAESSDISYSQKQAKVRRERFSKAVASIKILEEKLKSGKTDGVSHAFTVATDDLYDVNNQYTAMEDDEDYKTTLKAAEAMKQIKMPKAMGAKEKAELKELEKKALDRLSDTNSNGSNSFEEGLCGMTTAEMLAIYYYTGNGYSNLNANLRKKKDPPLKYRLFREVLNSALGKLKKFGGEVQRGISNAPDSFFESHQPGKVVTYDAFTSTSKDNGFGGDQKFVIKSKTGHFIGPMSSSPGENEVLFSAGTKFKILEVNLEDPIEKSDDKETIAYKKKNVKIIMEEIK